MGSELGVHGFSCSKACGIFPDQGSNPTAPAFQCRFITSGPHEPKGFVLFGLVSGFSTWTCTCAKSLQDCLTLCDPIDGSPTRLLCPRDSPGKHTGVGGHALLLWKTWMSFLKNLLCHSFFLVNTEAGWSWFLKFLQKQETHFVFTNVHMMFLQVYFEKKKKMGDISTPTLVCSAEFFSDTYIYIYIYIPI